VREACRGDVEAGGKSWLPKVKGKAGGGGGDGDGGCLGIGGVDTRSH
jgi:hypothetical protein